MNRELTNICLNKDNPCLILGNKGRAGFGWIVPAVPVSTTECSHYTISTFKRCFKCYF